MLLAGLVGLPLFLAGTSVAGLFAPDYRRVSGHASELSLVPGLASTLFKITAIPWELSFVVFGTGLLRLADWRSFGAVCWILFGVAMRSNGIWLNLLGLDPQACRGATQRLFSSINSFWAFYVGWWALRTGR